MIKRTHAKNANVDVPRITGRSILSELLFGAVTIVLVAASKFAWDESSVGKRFERFVETELQRRLADFEGNTALDAVVVDLGGLRAEPIEEGSNVYSTPPDKLFRIFESIASAKPLAICADVDFSSKSKESKHPLHPKFFQDCLDLQKATQVPIILGVYDGLNHKDGEWLGANSFAPLAAGIAISNQTFRIQTWRDAGFGKLDSMSQKMARVLDAEVPPNAGKLGWLLETEHRRFAKAADGSTVEVAEIIYDAGTLHRLIDTTFPTVEISALREEKAQTLFQGKVVILGDGYSTATDKYPVPGITLPETPETNREAVPGVYIHACAGLTPNRGYLWQLTHGGRIFVDVIIVVIILLVIVGLRSLILLKGWDKDVNERFLHHCLTLVSVTAILFIAFLFVRQFRLFWTDFPLVIVALLIHRSVHHWLEHHTHSFLCWFGENAVVATKKQRSRK